MTRSTLQEASTVPAGKLRYRIVAKGFNTAGFAGGRGIPPKAFEFLKNWWQQEKKGLISGRKWIPYILP